MKKAVILILMVSMLLISACNTVVAPVAVTPEITATPEPTPTPIPTPEPTPIPETPEEIAKWVAETYHNGLEHERTSYYSLCTMPKVSDYAYIAEGFPISLYQYPYNAKSSARDQFVYPKDITAEIAEAAIEATKIEAQYFTRDYRDMSIWKNAASILLPDTEEWQKYIAEEEEKALKNRLIWVANIATDKSLCYIDDSGHVRIRGVAFMKTVQSDAASSRRIDVWYTQQHEYILAKNENGYYVWDVICIDPNEKVIYGEYEELLAIKGYGDIDEKVS